MQKLILGLTLSASVASVASIVACGDNPADRTSFDEGDAADDAPANLSETGTPYDAGPKPDAKEPYSSADEEVFCKNEAGPCVKDLVAGEGHFCARMADGTVRCWGKDDFGNLGHGNAGGDMGDGGSLIVPVSGLSGVTQISAGGNTTCARLEDGTVRCWGGNKNAELALTVEPATTDQDPHPEPIAPADVPAVTRIDVGHGAVCALLPSGKLTCWGKDMTDQLAREVPPYTFNVGPGEAQIDLPLAAVHGGSNSTFGVTESADLFVWGALSGQDGFCSGVVAALSPSRAPHQVQLSKVTSFGVSLHFQPPNPPLLPGERPKPPLPQQAHACAITNGEVYCWGRSDKAALCTGLPDPEKVPRRAPVVSNAWPQRLSVGHEITCVRMTDGTVQCCGSNDKGRLGFPSTTTHSSTFIAAGTFKGRAVKVATTNGSVCALVQGGTVECWGGNLHGELATAFPDEADHPETHEVAF